jgi:glucosylceramidase
MYWNISLDKDPANSRWRWPQNSLISVNQENKTYKYNPEYYLIKQFSHFVKPGAKRLPTEGSYENMLAFLNPDSSIVIVAANEGDANQMLKIKVNDRMMAVNMKMKSINTFLIEAKK